MNINEKAKNYAEGKALDALTKAIEDAYASGYKEGYSDGVAAQEPKSLDEKDNGVEYVDLGLPSGTLWSSKYLYEGEKFQYLSYLEAAEYNIPTKEQFDELLDNCKCIDFDKTKRLLGKNANYIELYNTYVFKAGIGEWQNHISFWLKKDDEDEYSAPCACKTNWVTDRIENVFMGYKMPIMLVKTRNNK